MCKTRKKNHDDDVLSDFFVLSQFTYTTKVYQNSVYGCSTITH